MDEAPKIEGYVIVFVVDNRLSISVIDRNSRFQTDNLKSLGDWPAISKPPSDWLRAPANESQLGNPS